jgi:transcriptional regulator with XRE-family HTH domain
MGAKSRPLTPDRSIRHLFGYQLRQHRETAKMSLERLSKEVRYSTSHLSRIEAAEVAIPEELPPALDRVFKKDDAFFTNLYGHSLREIHPEAFRHSLEIESRARLIEEYSCHIVPGLLQTEDYARAQFVAADPKLTATEIDELAIGRMSRQARLYSASPPEYSAILDESALRRPLGGPAVMRAQLARLEKLTFTGHTVIQVMPFQHGAHSLLGASLVLLTTPDGMQVAWEESMTTGTLIEDRTAVAALHRRYDLLRACALSPRESAAFIRSVMEELPT